MSEEQTCGEGLAQRAALPAKLAELTGAMAEILDFHRRSLDVSDENARKELQAYARLVGQYHTASTLLQSTSAMMSGYRDLPMAPHDVSVLTSAENVAIFSRFVAVERELAELAKTSLERDEAMLAQMAPQRPA